MPWRLVVAAQHLVDLLWESMSSWSPVKAALVWWPLSLPLF
ncbi:hypothetical protein SynMEDNS5_00221 [Synechococcus sp. MEDNS5]|nr:hypothetical protein SynMEDNS5_00221 [Synechococcus sp. MEDNS5]